jgi:hypothetical protein
MHNFLTQRTEDFLKESTEVKSLHDNKFFTDREFFKKIQEKELEKAFMIMFSYPQTLKKVKQAKQYNEIFQHNEFYEGVTKDKKYEKEFNGETVRLNKCNLFFPEIVDIEYNDYSNAELFKDDLFAQDYKDGFMVVSQEIDDVKIPIHMSMGGVLKNGKPIDEKDTFSAIDTEDIFGKEAKTFGKNVFQISSSITKNFESFRNYGQVTWSDKKFDDKVIMYFVAPKINKTKALRIDLGNNVRMKSLLKIFRKNPQEGRTLSQIKFLRDKTQAWNVTMEYGTEKFHKNHPNMNATELKKFLLKVSYKKCLLSNYKINMFHEEDFNHNEYISKCRTSLENLKKYYMEEVYPYEEKLASLHIPNPKKDKDVFNAYIKKIIIKSSVMGFFCSENTLPSGVKINTEHKSLNDCFLFWSQIGLFELLFNLFNEHNSKLLFVSAGSVNDLNAAKDPSKGSSFTVFATSIDPWWVTAEQDESYKAMVKLSHMGFEFKDKHVLQEAMDSETGYLMPYDGAFELLDDPLYKFIRFREYEDLITIVISDKNERCLVEVFDKKKVDFKYMLWNDLKFSKDTTIENIQDIYLKLATCIRDSKVLIERNSTMKFRGRRTPHGCNTKSTYEIYFPRVRYRRNPNKEQLRREKDFFAESRKFQGTRRHHARKLVAGYKADKKQLLLAKQMDFYVPEGHTYVKASTWGDNMTKREVRYRHTDLNGMFYVSKTEMSEAQKIDQLSSAGFEEYCENYIQKLGYEVKHRSNYDGGIDIRAVRILDNMEAEDLLVQCKHWNSPIPPGAMRDFKTACDMEETKNSKKFMFITSSRFSPGAVELADKFDIEIVDGDRLINEME